MKKKFRSNWKRVAVEGATSDKRTIQRSWLEQAAKNFNPDTYGARVWLEHYRSVVPDSPFKAYGDVVALKTEEVEINGQKKLALFAQIEPTADLIALNKAKQKLYTSIEIDDKFADTNEAYLVGLAVTDSPASLGTEVLSFAMQKPEANPFAGRHFSASSMFSEAIELGDFEFTEVNEEDPAGQGMFNKVKELLGLAKKNDAQHSAQFADVDKAVTVVAEFSKELDGQLKQAKQKITELSNQLEKTTSDLAALTKKLAFTQDPGQPNRPASTGGDGVVQTNF